MESKVFGDNELNEIIDNPIHCLSSLVPSNLSVVLEDSVNNLKTERKMTLEPPTTGNPKLASRYVFPHNIELKWILLKSRFLSIFTIFHQDYDF